MSELKLIACPGCGAGYPDTKTRCPLCGFSNAWSIAIKKACNDDNADAIKRVRESDTPRNPNSARFYELLEEIGALHAKKQRDYGSDSDPFANVRASEEWGAAPWVGAMIRLNDKVRRLQQFARKGSLANESAIDSMKDIAVYALIALVLYEQESKK